MTFEFANPVYYLGDRSQSWQVPASIALLETQLDNLIAESISSGSLATETLKLTAKVGVPGQILAETVEVFVEADGNTITFKDGSGFVLEQVTEATGSAALSFVFSAGAALFVASPPGWLSVTVAATGAALYDVFLEENVEQLIEEVSNAVDAEFKLVSATGDVLGGVWYRDGLLGAETIILANAIYDILGKRAEGFPLAEEGMKIQYLYGDNLQDEFTVYDGQRIEDLANFLDVNVEDFLDTSDPLALAAWVKQSSELPFNLYYSNNGDSWVFARDSDLLSINISGDEVDSDYRDFHPSDIFTGAPFQSGNNNDNLIIGTTGDDMALGAGHGDDLIFGWTGNDILIGSAGNDILDGGNGTDTADYSDWGQSISVELSSDPNFDFTVRKDLYTADSLKNIEIIQGTAHAYDTINITPANDNNPQNLRRAA